MSFGIILEHSGNPPKQNQTSKSQILYIRLGEIFFTFPTHSLVCKDLYPCGSRSGSPQLAGNKWNKRVVVQTNGFQNLPTFKNRDTEDIPLPYSSPPPQPPDLMLNSVLTLRPLAACWWFTLIRKQRKGPYKSNRWCSPLQVCPATVQISLSRLSGQNGVLPQHTICLSAVWGSRTIQFEFGSCISKDPCTPNPCLKIKLSQCLCLFFNWRFSLYQTVKIQRWD